MQEIVGDVVIRWLIVLLRPVLICPVNLERISAGIRTKSRSTSVIVA